MPENDVWTVKRILEWTTSHLEKHGSDSPRLDAEILLAHARSCERIELYTRFDEPLSDDERSAMRELVSRRAKREPVAYLVGYREFYSLKFQVSPDVLIPRPDTETLVMEALERGHTIRQPRVLDLCTGSGCIAVAFAANHLGASLVASDISPAALAIARENAEQHGVADRIEFREGDMLNALDAAGEKFDLILSNPPYVCDHEAKTLDPDITNYEPHQALFAGEDGLNLIRPLIKEAPNYLNETGILFIEMDPSQIEAATEWARSTTNFKQFGSAKDLTGRARVFRASHQEAPVTSTESVPTQTSST